MAPLLLMAPLPSGEDRIALHVRDRDGFLLHRQEAELLRELRLLGFQLFDQIPLEHSYLLGQLLHRFHRLGGTSRPASP